MASELSSKKTRDTVTDTALHILKGAIVKVLNTPLTTTVECKSHTKGKISVEYTLSEVPTDAQVQEIERLANEKIKDNVPIEIIPKLNRKEAEDRFRRDLVNGTFIYDKFPVPDSVTELTLVHIPGWTINSCPFEHLKSTGEIGAIEIVKLNFRPIKHELEFAFEVLPKGKEPPQSKQTAASKQPTSQKTTATTLKTKPDDVPAVTSMLLDMILKEATANNNHNAAVSDEQLKANLTLRVESILSSLKNTAYSSGFQARIVQ